MKYFLAIPFFLISFFSLSQTFDNTFKPIITTPAAVNTMAIQSDGKVIVAGTFVYSGAQVTSNIIRLNADGTRDLTFVTGTGVDGRVNEIVVQSDGKILVGGSFFTFNGVSKKSLVRLNSNGSVDTSFTDFNSQSSSSSGNGIVNGLALQSDGKIIIRGFFHTVNGVAHNGIVRLNADGTIDSSFNASVPVNGSTIGKEMVKVLATGKILISGTFTTVNSVAYNRIARLNADGTTDATFNPGTGFNDKVHSMVVLADGKILACGWFTSYNGTTVNKFLRLTESGALDTTFPNTIGFNSGNSVDVIALQADGKILLGGTFQNPALRILRLTAAGAIDGTFSSGTGIQGVNANGVYSIVVGATNIYLGGDFITYNGTLRNSLAAVNTSGTLVAGIDHKLGVLGTVKGAHIQSDGKVLVGGDFTYINGTTSVRIGRLNTNGSLDATFNIGSGFNDLVNSISAQSDGRILVGGIFSSYNGNTVGQLVRLNTNGSRDTGFTPVLTRTFSSGGVYEIHTYASDKILISGGFTQVNGTAYKNLARLNSNGTTDVTFQNNDFTASYMMDMDVRESDGAILVTSNINSVKDLALLDANGNVVSSFDVKPKISFAPYAVAFTPDGKILFGGSFTYNGGSTIKAIKLEANANPDPTFNYGSTTADVSKIKIVNSRYIFGLGDYYGFTPGTANIVNSQGSIFSSISSLGTTSNIVKGTNEFYVAGKVSNPTVTDVNGLLKFSLLPAPSTAPSALQATVQQGKVILSWTYGLSDAIGFEIYRAKPAAAFTAIGVTASGVTTYTDLSADPETQYRYIVKAVYLSGDTPSSNEVTVTTLPDKPRTPANLVLTEVSPIEIKLDWQDVSINETEMLVYRLAPGEPSYVLLATLPANTITYNDKFLTPGKTYYYYVTAKNSIGESPMGAAKVLTLSDPTLGTWSNRNPASNIQRYSAVAFVIGTKAYVGTGRNATGRLKDFWEYDPANDSWTKKADFPGSARVAAVGFALNGKGYLGTGNDGVLVDGMVRFKRDFYQYDPVTDTWTQVADYPEDFTSGGGISSGAAFVIGSYAYVGLGNTGVNNPKAFFRYDPVTNQWAKMADFAGAGRPGAVAFAGTDRGYFGLGGVDSKYKDVWEYNPVANSWTKLVTDFTSTARTGAVAFVINNRAYIGTGDAGDLFTEVNKVDFRELNLTTKTWRTIPDFTGTARTSATAFAIGNNAYVGLGASGATYFDDLKSYLPGTTFLPNKPTNLAGTVTGNSVSLTWSDQSDNELAFILERSKTNQTSFVRIAVLDPNVVSFSDNTVDAGATYYYRVFSSNLYGPSEYSNTAALSILAPPTMPTNFQATYFAADKIKLQWSSVVGATSYRIYRAAHDNQNNEIEAYKIIESAWTTTTYTDQGLQQLIYTYKIQAVNGGGISAFSEEKTVNLYSPPPTTPLSFTASSLALDQVKLQWQSVSTAASYRIYRTVHDANNNEVEAYKIIENAWTGITYTDQGLQPLVYTYKIQAVNVGGASAFTPEKTVSLYVPAPSAPINFTVSFVTLDKVKLQWQAVSTATSYRIYRTAHDMDNNEVEAYIPLVNDLATTTYTDEGLELLTYTYKVQAVNSGGASPFSEEKSIDLMLISALPEESNDIRLKVYPNPASAELVVETKKTGQTVHIINAQGKVLHMYTLNDNINVLSVSMLPAGFYILKAMDGTKAVQRKFFKE